MQLNELALMAFISGSLNLLTGIQVYRQKIVVVAKSCLYAMLGLTTYIWGYAAELTTLTEQQAWFWLQVKYLGLNVALFFFAKCIMELSGIRTQPYYVGLTFLWLLGACHFLLLLTNPLHGWYYREIKMIPLWGA